MIEHTEKVEQVLKQVAKVLATNTNYAAMISAPSYQKSRVKFIQLSQVDDEQILAVIVREGNIVKNKIISVGEPLGNERLLKLNILLNSNLNGLSIDQINLGMISLLKEQAGIDSGIVSDVLDAVAEAIGEGIQVYIGNETPIQTMKDCSVVTATYELGEGIQGTIGIIGPKRMDYENVMDNLKNLKVQLDDIFRKPKD